MSSLAQQVYDNRNAIQSIIDAIKRIGELPPMTQTVSGTDRIALEIAETETTVYATVDQILNAGTSNNGLTELYSGDAIWLGGLDFYVWAEHFRINGYEYDNKKREANITLDAADPTNDRIDVFKIVRDGVGNVTIVNETGTPAPTPTKPVLDDEFELEISFAYIEAGATGARDLTSDVVYGDGEVWTISGGDASITNESTANPIDGTYSISFDDVPHRTQMVFTRGVQLETSSTTTLRFDIHLDSAWADRNYWQPVIRLTMLYQGVPISETYRIGHTAGQLDTQNTLTKQTVTLRLGDDNVFRNSPYFDGIELEFRYLTGEQFRIDNFYVGDGTVVVQPPSVSQNYYLSDMLDVPLEPVGTTDKYLLSYDDNTDTHSWIQHSLLSPTGLEKIDEGNGGGWALIGTDRTQEAPIGNGSIVFGDSSLYPAPTKYNGYGVEADYSYAFGGGHYLPQHTNNYGGHFTLGAENEVKGYFNNMAMGTKNILSQGYSAMLIGYGNNANLNQTTGHSLIAGNHNEGFNYWTHAIGTRLITKGKGQVAVGIGNTDYTGSVTATDRPIFVVGIGDANANFGASYGDIITRADGFIVRKDGSVIAPTITNTLIDAVGAKSLVSREWVLANAGGASSLQDVTDVGDTTTNNINYVRIYGGTSVNDSRIAIGQNAGLNGSASFSTVFFGPNAGRDNTQNMVMGIGLNALRNNTGSYSTGVGQDSGRNNTGVNFTGLGFLSGEFNKGINSIMLGYYSGRNNLGNNLTALGRGAGQDNLGINNTFIGYGITGFVENVANAKNVANAGTDVDTVLSRITITGHGFGSNGTYVNLKYTTTGTVISPLVDGEVYRFYIVDSNTIEYAGFLNTTGTNTHTFTPQFNYSNITALGYNAQITASNQVVLGDSNVTEVLTYGQYNIAQMHTAPASATATGKLGEVRVTATHIYVCTATNTWVRAALTTW